MSNIDILFINIPYPIMSNIDILFINILYPIMSNIDILFINIPYPIMSNNTEQGSTEGQIYSIYGSRICESM